MKKLLPLLVALQSVGVLAAGGVVAVNASHGSARPVAKVEKVEKVDAKKKAEVKKEEPPLDPRAVISELYDGNDRFMHGVTRHRDLLADRNALTTSQHPKAIILSCSDSRVPPEMVFDETVGDLFVVRTAGNVADTMALASLEYAAEHLRTPVLVVMGHEKCGAVTAAATGEKMESPNLQALVDEIAPSLSRLKAKYQGPELVHHGVEANVSQVSDRLLERSAVIRKLVEEGKLNIVRAVYELDTGHVRWLDLDDETPKAAVAEEEPAVAPAPKKSPGPRAARPESTAKKAVKAPTEEEEPAPAAKKPAAPAADDETPAIPKHGGH